MFDFFSKFGSCYRFRRRKRTATDDSFLCHIDTSGDCRRRERGNSVYCRRNRASDWRPALSVIREGRLDQDHNIDVNRKSDESSGKNKSVVNVACIDRRHDKKSPKPKIYVSYFSATPYMF